MNDLELLGRLDEIITKQIDISNNQVECQTLRWVLDVMSEMSAGATQGWIPVSKRLPDKDGQYLVTIGSSLGGTEKTYFTEFAKFATNLYEVSEFDFYDRKRECGWYEYDSEWGYYEHRDVVAWMPCIEPYIPGEDSGEVEE